MPTDARAFDTTPDTTSGGATGALSAFGTARVSRGTASISRAPSTVEKVLATDSTAASVAVRGWAVDAGVAAAWTTTVDCWFADVELADPERFVGSLPAEFGALCDSPCGASGVRGAAVATGVFGVAASRASGDGTGSAEGAGAAGCSVGDAAVGRWVGNAAAGGSAGAAVATAEGTPVWVSVAPADAVVSLLDGVELVCAPPDFFLIPERGSAVEASRGEEVELAWASTELCTTPDVEPDEETAAEADESVDDVGSVADVLAADSDDELEADDDESDDEREELVSVGSANATPGVLATAAPAPSANANTPARTMYCAVTGTAFSGEPPRAPAERPPA
jgi:hypothetical protein